MARLLRSGDEVPVANKDGVVVFVIIEFIIQGIIHARLRNEPNLKVVLTYLPEGRYAIVRGGLGRAIEQQSEDKKTNSKMVPDHEYHPWELLATLQTHCVEGIISWNRQRNTYSVLRSISQTYPRRYNEKATVKYYVFEADGCEIWILNNKELIQTYR